MLISDDDPAWPALFEVEAAKNRIATGPAALLIEHVGSTSAPDLPAEPAIDINLPVADEAAYARDRRGDLSSGGGAGHSGGNPRIPEPPCPRPRRPNPIR